ncbi:MAG: hypothetical protein CMA66_01605 [Euryarchaeota archaeon]|jgi:uncharacterized protein (TIGR00270 family)|nr:hypothetical protein [Euryarchaeota archaeon]|tara:strand:- start:40 stop:528 length:489 start_codon:yes stop_codon:yes gene_type:complete
MGECEVCGAMKVGTKQIMMGKAQVYACTRCVEKLGLAPKEEAPGIKMSRARTSFSAPKPRRKNDIMAKREKELADDFGNRIANGRKAKGWNHAELGKRIAETVNVIKSAESGKPPTDSLIKKLERVLDIVLLVESTPSETSRVIPQGNRNMTLGDYFKQNGA